MPDQITTQTNWIENILGANWKTTITGMGAWLSSIMTTLAALPYDKTTMQLVPPEWQPFVIKSGIVCTVILGIMNSHFQKSKNVTGGRVIQTPEGEVQAKIVPKS